MGRFDLSAPTRWKLFLCAAVAAVLLSAWLSRYDRDLASADGQGIVAFEVAGSGARAEDILCAWGRAGVIGRARASLLVDFLFLMAYPLAIGLGCGWAAGALERQRVVSPDRGGRLLRGLGWAQVATFLFDATENVALLLVIGRFEAGRPIGDVLPAVARWCALPKFLLVGLGLVTVLGALGLRALGRRRGGPVPTDRPAGGAADG